MKNYLARALVLGLALGVIVGLSDQAVLAWGLGDMLDPAGIMGSDIHEFADKYPGATTALLTGDPMLAGGMHNVSTMINPGSETKGTDALLSGAFFTDPAGYHGSTFLSGSSGEPRNLEGLANYTGRVTAGTVMGAGSGAARGWSYGGPWGALGGAITEGSLGGLAGSLTHEQNNKLVDDMALGTDGFLKDYGLGKDMQDFHNASWEMGHDHTYGNDANALNARIGMDWAGAAGKMAGNKFGPMGMEKLNETLGSSFPTSW